MEGDEAVEEKEEEGENPDADTVADA